MFTYRPFKTTVGVSHILAMSSCLFNKIMFIHILTRLTLQTMAYETRQWDTSTKLLPSLQIRLFFILNTIETRSLRLTCGKTMNDRVKNVEIKKLCKTDVSVIVKLKKRTFKIWFEHVE